MASYPIEPTIEAFGSSLLASGDLDPLYIALNGAFLPQDQLERWLFAYWCCYHAGASCWLSELSAPTYWTWLRVMASNDGPTPLGARWPRGHERRHFRGEAAVNAVETYAKTYTHPEELVRWLAVQGPSFRAVRLAAMSLPQFGPWIAFKVGDMLERVYGTKIDFAGADVFMFDSPLQAAFLVARTWTEHLGTLEGKSQQELATRVAQTLIQHFQHRLAPPRYDRPINIQEVETILCKWKSHLNGSYPLGLDTREIRHGLLEWSTVSQTAAKLLEAMPR